MSITLKQKHKYCRGMIRNIACNVSMTLAPLESINYNYDLVTRRIRDGTQH